MLIINKILFPTDFSICSRQAYPHALFLAEKYGPELHLLHVITIHTGDSYNPVYDFPHLKEYNIHLEKLPGSDVPVTINITEGFAAREIIW